MAKILIVWGIISYFLCLSNAYAETIRFFASLDSTMMSKKEEGIHVRNNNTQNPFGNIYGASLGASYLVPNTKFSITAKTNRLLKIPMVQQGKLYNNDTFIKNVTLKSSLESDVLAIGYAVRPFLIPFVFVSNSTFHSEVISDNNTVSNTTNAIFYGMGLNVFVCNTTSVSMAFVAPNSKANTTTGLNISINHKLLGF